MGSILHFYGSRKGEITHYVNILVKSNNAVKDILRYMINSIIISADVKMNRSLLKLIDNKKVFHGSGRLIPKLLIELNRRRYDFGICPSELMVFPDYNRFNIIISENETRLEMYQDHDPHHIIVEYFNKDSDHKGYPEDILKLLN